MIGSGRFRVIVWIAFADFFTAVALFAFALYGVQRQKEITIEEVVHLFARELYAALRKQGLQVEYDVERSRLTLAEAMVFDTNESKLKHPEVVHEIATALKAVQAANASSWDKTRSFHLVIRGHADARPMSGRTNVQLSQERARALEDALVEDGITVPAFQISAQGVGESEPKVDNCSPPTRELRTICSAKRYGSDEELAPNRRIELRFGFFSGS